jgi:very-short-patch-repair endonuclease
MFISKIDGTEFSNIRKLGFHVKMYGYSLEEYFMKYENFIIPKCKVCGNNAAHWYAITYRKTCGDVSCVNTLGSQRIHTEETKQKIRKGRHEFLKKKTGQTAWERRAAGKLSYLEQWFLDNVIEKYNLDKEFDIANEYSVFPYFVDFAFLNIKLAVELDGACHFSNGTERIDHDDKKDKHLIDLGWKIFRISYKELNIETIDKFISTIHNIEKISDKVLGGIVHKRLSSKKSPKYGTRKDYAMSMQLQNKPKNDIRIELILQSNIDFSKFGWIQKVAKLFEISPQKISGWMKKHMPDFYNEKCFIVRRTE